MAPLDPCDRSTERRQLAPGSYQQKLVEGDTLVIYATFPTLDSVACTIDASRLIDTRGEVAAYQQRTINKVEGQGTMIKLAIPIYEVTA